MSGARGTRLQQLADEVLAVRADEAQRVVVEWSALVLVHQLVELAEHLLPGPSPTQSRFLSEFPGDAKSSRGDAKSSRWVTLRALAE